MTVPQVAFYFAIELSRESHLLTRFPPPALSRSASPSMYVCRVIGR